MDWVLLILGLIVGIELIVGVFWLCLWSILKYEDYLYYKENIKPDNHRYINLLKR